MPQSLIFYHFGTKENLLLALIRERSTRTLADLVPADPPKDPRAAIAQLWSSLRAHLGGPSAMHRIVKREADNHPELRQRALRIYNDLTGVVAGFLTRTTGRRGEPSAEVWAAARMLVATSAAASGGHGDDEGHPTSEAVANLLVDGLLAEPRER